MLTRGDSNMNIQKQLREEFIALENSQVTISRQVESCTSTENCLSDRHLHSTERRFVKMWGEDCELMG